MLRKRGRRSHHDLSQSQEKPDCDQENSSFAGNRSMPVFNVPGLFAGFSGKAQSDYDSARSPISPLDWKCSGNFLNPLASPRRGSSCLQRSWYRDRMGLGLIDCLRDEPAPSKKFLGVLKNCNVSCGFEKSISNLCKGSSTASIITNPLSQHDAKSPNSDSVSLEKSTIFFPPSESIAILPAPSVLSKTEPYSTNHVQSSLPLPRLVYYNPTPNSDSFPASDAKETLKLGNFSGQPSSLPIPVISSRGFYGSLSTKEIELSEDYTRITSHGPNPKTTHIFGDCILERHTIELSDDNAEDWLVGLPCPNSDYPLNDFLNFCFSCKKKMEEGKDIYIYRGEKAFCSSDCRAQEILIEEEADEHGSDCLPPNSPCSGNSIPTTMATASQIEGEHIALPILL